MSLFHEILYNILLVFLFFCSFFVILKSQIVPIEALSNPKHFQILTTELFGPFQILVRWSDGQLEDVLDALNNMQNHLTAGIVSNDP